MKDQETIEAAWEISTLMNKLNDLIWDQYEDAFIDRYMKEQELKYPARKRKAGASFRDSKRTFLSIMGWDGTIVIPDRSSSFSPEGNNTS